MTRNNTWWAQKHHLSYSQIVSFTCPYRWALAYKRGIQRRTVSGPMRLGSFVHQGIAAHLLDRPVEDTLRHRWEQDANDRQLSVDARAEGYEALELSIGIVYRTIDEINKLGWQTVWFTDPDGVRLPLVEQKLCAPLSPFAGFVGVVDWVARDPASGLVWLVDWKTRKALQGPETEDTNLQLAAYQHLLTRNGVETTGTCLFQIRSETPRWPKRNKDGSMSRAACITDWATYREALLAAGLDPADYVDMADKLADNKFFDPLFAYRSPELVASFWKQIVQRAAWAIGRVKMHPWRNMTGLECRGCLVREFCLAELRGEDTDWLLQTEYQYKPGFGPGEEANA